MIALDAGRTFNGGKPPAELSFGDVRIPNPRKDSSPRTFLGARQKAMVHGPAPRSTATWKIWGSSLGALDSRADPQIFPMDSPGRRGQPTPSRKSAAATTAARTTSVARSMTSFAMRRSPDSRSCQATVTASGPAMLLRLLPPAHVRAGRGQFRLRLAGQPRAMEAFEHRLAKIIRSVRCSWPIGQRASPNGPTTCSSSTASVRASSTPELRPRRALGGVESEARPAPRVRRHGRSRLCDGAAHQR